MSRMVAVRAHSLLTNADERPSVILVHGAANSARVWTFWQGELARRGWSSHALDLRCHGARAPAELGTTRMADYADDVVAFARALREPPVLLGWSMGGLVALMAAAACRARACVGLAPSAPARTLDSAAPLRAGTFGPEEYGIVDSDPEHQPAMEDLDRDERKAGVVVGNASCPVLIVTGTADRLWPRQRYDDFPLAADHIEIMGA